MATCETHGHLRGPGNLCVMCKTPLDSPSSKERLTLAQISAHYQRAHFHDADTLLKITAGELTSLCSDLCATQNEIEDLQKRLDFAATVLGVVERRRDGLRDERDALRKQLPQPPSGSRWQPIATAPRHKSILVSSNNSDGFEAYQDSTGNWHCMDGTNGKMTYLIVTPEYWMPLPGPPATKASPPSDALLQACVNSMAGYRRELNDGQPCDAEKAARAYLTKSVIDSVAEYTAAGSKDARERMTDAIYADEPDCICASPQIASPDCKACFPIETSAVLDHRFTPDGMDPGICAKCGSTRKSHRASSSERASRDE